MTYFCLTSFQLTFYASHHIPPETKPRISPMAGTLQWGCPCESSEEYSLLAEALQIGTFLLGHVFNSGFVQTLSCLPVSAI